MRAWPWLLRLIVLLTAPWVIPYAYTFTSGPFTGEPFNPYDTASGRWFRANFHGHTRSWGSLTNGTLPIDEVIRRYHALGYHVPTITNYMSLTKESAVLAYEHGLNLPRTHRLALGATSVFWFDQLWPSLNGKQFIIDGVHDRAFLVAIPHPMLDRRSYQMSDFEVLDNYELLEAANRLRLNTDTWDKMLTYGHRAWGIGNDDSHDLTNPDDWGVAWTMVRAESEDDIDVLAALAAGHTYTVRVDAPHSEQWLHFAHQTLRGEVVHASFEETAEKIRCVGNAGEERASVENASAISCTMQPNDGFMRIEGFRNGTTLLLNPVTRAYSPARHEIDWAHTADSWLGALVAWLLGEIILRKLIQSHAGARKTAAPRASS